MPLDPQRHGSLHTNHMRLRPPSDLPRRQLLKSTPPSNHMIRSEVDTTIRSYDQIQTNKCEVVTRFRLKAGLTHPGLKSFPLSLSLSLSVSLCIFRVPASTTLLFHSTGFSDSIKSHFASVVGDTFDFSYLLRAHVYFAASRNTDLIECRWHLPHYTPSPNNGCIEPQFKHGINTRADENGTCNRRTSRH